MGDIETTAQFFSGFIFKIQANMNKTHRDRIAFLRVCSGKLEKLKFYHHVRMNRKVRFANLATFMAQDKNAVEEAALLKLAVDISHIPSMVFKQNMSSSKHLTWRASKASTKPSPGRGSKRSTPLHHMQQALTIDCGLGEVSCGQQGGDGPSNFYFNDD